MKISGRLFSIFLLILFDSSFKTYLTTTLLGTPKSTIKLMVIVDMNRPKQDSKFIRDKFLTFFKGV